MNNPLMTWVIMGLIAHHLIDIGEATAGPEDQTFEGVGAGLRITAFARVRHHGELQDEEESQKILQKFAAAAWIRTWGVNGRSPDRMPDQVGFLPINIHIEDPNVYGVTEWGVIGLSGELFYGNGFNSHFRDMEWCAADSNFSGRVDFARDSTPIKRVLVFPGCLRVGNADSVRVHLGRVVVTLRKKPVPEGRP